MTIDIDDRRKMHRSMAGPSWRWKLALELVGSSSSWLAEFADELVTDTASFIALTFNDVNGEALAKERYFDIWQAKSLWDQPNLRQEFVILTLGDCPRDEVAKRLNVELKTVELIERLFFDVRECRSATGWINGHVILSESRIGSPGLATKYRAAFWGGPLIAAAILDSRGRVSLDEVTRIADQEFLLHMRAQEALEIPLHDARNATDYLKFYTDHELKKARLELAKEKFRHDCEQDIRKHELAERRLVAAINREENRAEMKRQIESQRSASQMDEENLAELRAQIHRERLLHEQNLAHERALKSPLAQLSWKPGSCSNTSTTIEPPNQTRTPTKVESSDISSTSGVTHTAA